MNASGRYLSFASDDAIMYGMNSSTSWSVSNSASAPHNVASYSHELSPKHCESTLNSIDPKAGDDSV